MGISQLTNREAVLRAIQEYDTLGRETFLAKYGFGKAKRYILCYGGRTYDSKAIAGVAYGYQYPQHGPLKSSEFCGGEDTVKKCLGAMGFKVKS